MLTSVTWMVIAYISLVLLVSWLACDADAAVWQAGWVEARSHTRWCSDLIVGATRNLWELACLRYRRCGLAGRLG